MKVEVTISVDTATRALKFLERNWNEHMKAGAFEEPECEAVAELIDALHDADRISISDK